MLSLYDTQELPELQAEFASFCTEFRNWLCWPEMHQAATGLAPSDPPTTEPLSGLLLPGLSVPGWLSDLPWSMLAELGGPAGRWPLSRWAPVASLAAAWWQR